MIIFICTLHSLSSMFAKSFFLKAEFISKILTIYSSATVYNSIFNQFLFRLKESECLQER
jgi:hypothetical protein